MGQLSNETDGVSDQDVGVALELNLPGQRVQRGKQTILDQDIFGTR